MRVLAALLFTWLVSFTLGCRAVKPETVPEAPAATPSVISMESQNGGEVQIAALPSSAPTPQSAIVFEKNGDSAHYTFSDGNARLDVEAGELTIRVSGQAFTCEIHIADGACVHLILSDGAAFTGTFRAATANAANITLDAASTWTLTDDTTVGAFIDADTGCQNIDSGGFSLSYDSENAANAPLAAGSVKLVGGGYLMPII